MKMQQVNIAFQQVENRISAWSEDRLLFVKKQSMISNIGASTRIENAVLTDAEIEWIETTITREPHAEYRNKEVHIKDKLSKDKERSIEEVVGYRRAIQLVYDLYQDFFPLKISDIKGLHREMLKYYSHADYYKGEFKKQSNSVIEIDYSTGKKTHVLKTAAPGPITSAAMRDLVSWYNKEINTCTWGPAAAVEFVFRFLAIHPFQDGNGRLSRLLFQLALMTRQEINFSRVLPLIAVDRSIEQTRSRYYAVLRKGSGGLFRQDPEEYNYGFFLDYMTEMLLKSFDNLKYYEKKYDRYASLSQTAVNVLECFKESPEQNLKTNDIILKTETPRRTVIYALNKLKEGGFIQKLGKGAGTRYKLVF
jgi:Fic family protein